MNLIEISPNWSTEAKEDPIVTIRGDSWRLSKVDSEQTQSAPQMNKTLSLAGLTINAMALIAPGAFLSGSSSAGRSLWSFHSPRHMVWSLLGVDTIILDRSFIRVAGKTLSRCWHR
jgi:hypothetical protein